MTSTGILDGSVSLIVRRMRRRTEWINVPSRISAQRNVEGVVEVGDAGADSLVLPQGRGLRRLPLILVEQLHVRRLFQAAGQEPPQIRRRLLE
jgi:hypothetical protein